MFHSVLEKCLINDLNVDEEINNYVNNLDRKLTNKEEFFIKKVSNDIKFVIDVLNKQKEYTNLDKVMFEKNIVIDFLLNLFLLFGPIFIFMIPFLFSD